MHREEIERTKSIIGFFLNNTEELHKISPNEIKDMFLMAVISMLSCDDEELWEMGAQLFYESCLHLDLDLKEKWEIYWHLTSYKFDRHGRGKNINLEKLYKHIFYAVKERVMESGWTEIEKKDSNLIVIVTSQMLGLGHAPTRRVVDYAYAISSGMGKEVVIVNDSGLHYEQYQYLNFMNEKYSYEPEWDGESIWPYKDKKFLFKQLKGLQPDIDELKETLEEIYQLKPELVYNIGGSSLLTDLCGIFTRTACFPCSSDIPRTMSQNLFVGRKLNEQDNDRLESLECWQKVYETVINYQMAESERSYSRSQFGIDEDAFLIGIVGNRLRAEVNDTFTDMINQIAGNIEGVHFLLMGKDENMENIKETIKYPENVHFVGRVEDAASAIKLCDLYCNPMRTGGGRSSFEALAQGVPVVTFEEGDVYYTCGEAFGVKNREEYIDRVVHYIRHPEYRKKMSTLARQRAAYLSDIEKTQRELLEKIL